MIDEETNLARIQAMREQLSIEEQRNMSSFEGAILVIEDLKRISRIADLKVKIEQALYIESVRRYM